MSTISSRKWAYVSAFEDPTSPKQLAVVELTPSGFVVTEMVDPSLEADVLGRIKEGLHYYPDDIDKALSRAASSYRFFVEL